MLNRLASGTERRDGGENLLDEADVDQVFGHGERGIAAEAVQQSVQGLTAGIENPVGMQASAEHVEPGYQRRDFRDGEILAASIEAQLAIGRIPAHVGREGSALGSNRRDFRIEHPIFDVRVYRQILDAQIARGQGVRGNGA